MVDRVVAPGRTSSNMFGGSLLEKAGLTRRPERIKNTNGSGRAESNNVLDEEPKNRASSNGTVVMNRDATVVGKKVIAESTRSAKPETTKVEHPKSFKGAKHINFSKLDRLTNAYKYFPNIKGDCYLIGEAVPSKDGKQRFAFLEVKNRQDGGKGRQMEIRYLKVGGSQGNIITNSKLHQSLKDTQREKGGFDISSLPVVSNAGGEKWHKFTSSRDINGNEFTSVIRKDQEGRLQVKTISPVERVSELPVFEINKVELPDMSSHWPVKYNIQNADTDLSNLRMSSALFSMLENTKHSDGNGNKWKLYKTYVDPQGDKRFVLVVKHEGGFKAMVAKSPTRPNMKTFVDAAMQTNSTPPVGSEDVRPRPVTGKRTNTTESAPAKRSLMNVLSFGLFGGNRV